MTKMKSKEGKHSKKLTKSNPSESSGSNSTETERLIDHTVGLEEASKILKRPIGYILEYALRDAITIRYITSHGCYGELTQTDLSKFIVDINRKIPIPKRVVNHLIRAEIIKKYDLYPFTNPEYFISKDSLRISKEDLPALKKRLEAEDTMRIFREDLPALEKRLEAEDTMRIFREDLPALEKRLEAENKQTNLKKNRRKRVSDKELKKLLVKTEKELMESDPKGFYLQLLFNAVSKRTKELDPKKKGLTPSTIKTRYYELNPRKQRSKS